MLNRFWRSIYKQVVWGKKPLIWIMKNKDWQLKPPASRTALSNRIIHHLRGSVWKTPVNYNVSVCVTRVRARQKGCDHLSTTAYWGVFNVHQYQGNTLLLWLFLRRKKQQGCRLSRHSKCSLSCWIQILNNN